MNRLALCLLLLTTLVGCEPTTPEQAAQQKRDRPFAGATAKHDDARGVTCWVSDDSRAGLSCLPDWMLQKPELVGNERQLSPHETESEPTPVLAPGRWIDERYEL
ncbi:hypothetical protein [Pseudomonas sp.]|uniref:hypothetical protein n=1 Tax=Pseudomonas sp. TaxID=306 RepID=UPI003D6ED568